MRSLFITSLFLFGWLIGTAAQGAWGPQGCAPVGRTSTVDPSWRLYKGVYYHYTKGVQDAGFDPKTGEYRTYDAKTNKWSEPRTKDCKCDPCACNGCKCGQKVEKVGEFLFGVEADKLCKDGSCRYSINGKPSSKHEAMAAVQFADDSLKPFVTFIGKGRDALLKAFQATPEASKVRVNSYDSDEWYVKPLGFKTDGNPTVYIQNAVGEVLYRADSDPGLEKLVNEVRKADPAYDPSKDPTGSVDFLAYLKKLPSTIWFAVGFVVTLLFIKFKG